MTNEYDQRLHERLCAHVLGEGSPEKRAEMERELASSPELRAQCERIERTVGLVKHAMAGGESLSPEAAETVISAASVSRPSRLQSVPWLRMAAGIGALALGVAIVRESSQDLNLRGNGPTDTETARLQRDADNTRAAKLLKVGYADSVPPDAAGSADEKNPRSDPLVAEQEKSARDNWIRSMEQIDKSTILTQTDRQVFDDLKRWSEVNQRAPLTPLGDKPAGEVNQELAAGSDNFFVGQRQATSSQSGAVAPPQPGNEADAGSSNSAIGVDAGKKLEGSYSAKRSYGGSASKGKAAPAEERGRSGGATGPSTPGPSGPSTGGGGPAPAPATTPSPLEAKLAARRQLDSLGYGGGTLPSEQLAKLQEVTRSEREAVGFAKDDRKVVDEVTLDGAEDARRYYWQLSPADQQVYLDSQCRRILEGCVRWPNERPRDMFFRFWGDNPFEVAALDRLSTFSADVDTASYTLARRYLNEGNIPQKAQIRTEEFVNYFKSDVPAPTNGVFAIHTDLAPSRFSADTTRQMLRVVVRGKDLSKVERKPINLTFVVDVSGSMREQNRLEMVKHAIRLLVSQLDQYDKIGIVKFSTDASVVLPLTSVSDRALIESRINPLNPEGSTNSNAGLQLGYAIAMNGLDGIATSRVVFLSDGVANVGETDAARIADQVKPMREKGIYLNTIGVGMNNHNDVLLEQLADKADGMCTYIDSPAEAKRALVDNFTGAFQPIARDVKIQVDFDPAQVLRYRLLGYENRAIADADFRNDKVDAGELGAGHQVTALYEIERQSPSNAEAPLATVRVRWKEPRNFGTNAEQDAATEIAQTVMASQLKTFEAAGPSYRKVIIAAQFAEVLRRSIHARGDSLDVLLNEALRLQKEIPNDADFSELVLLISKSKDLILRTMPACDELCQAIDSVREAHYRRAQLELLQKEMDQKMVEDLKRQNDELEARLRELVRRRLEHQVK